MSIIKDTLTKGSTRKLTVRPFTADGENLDNREWVYVSIENFANHEEFVNINVSRSELLEALGVSDAW